jgi:hypothetical protein
MDEINVKNKNGMSTISKVVVGILAILLAGFLFVTIG